MYSYHTHTKIAPNGLPILGKLPFTEGDEVEVTIESKNGKPTPKKREFPLRGLKPFKYVDPYESAAPITDWEVLKDDSA
jgi:hypothetical protein